MTLWYNETHTWETRGGHTPSERIFGGSWPRPSVSDPTRVCVFHTFSTGSRSRGWEWRLRRRRGIRRTQVHRKSGGVQHCVTCLDLWLFARDTHKHTNAHAHTQTLHTHTHTHTHDRQILALRRQDKFQLLNYTKCKISTKMSS